MDKPVIVFVELFDRDQTVIMPDGTEFRVNIDDLPTYLPAVCQQYGVRSVDIYGPTLFTSDIVKKAKETNEYTKEIEFNVRGIFRS